MADSNFIDYVKICCRSGKGGAGFVHFHREKFVDKGGPDGGDGGRGGHIIARASRNVWTLIHLKYRKHVIAEEGGKGGSRLCSGLDGEDEILEVPVGTIIKNAETDEVEAELTEEGQEVIVAAGGRGGKGNAFFRSSTNQSPRNAQPGEPGKNEWKIFELKLLADVGLVGFPNTGKSSLLSVVSAAKPQIANYPFTTLVPNLGIVKYRSHQSFVMADIPGIIEGAAGGKGLGVRFLRHIERNSVLLFLVPCDTKDIVAEYKVLLNELKLYEPSLLKKEKVLAISKCDLMDDELMKELKKEMKKKFKVKNVPVVYISSHTHQGLVELKDLLWKAVNDK